MKKRLTKAEAEARRERLLKAGLIPEESPRATITLLQRKGEPEWDEQNPLRDDDGSGVVE